MTDRIDDEAFLARWSRRKAAARAGEPLPEPPAPADAAPAGAAATPSAGAKPEASPPEPLPPLESLKGLESDYKAFLRPGVAEDLKRAAIKKLFADPKFNVMDGLDVYIDDYTKFEPVPADVLGKLAAVKHLFRSPAAEPAAEAEPEAAAAAAAPVPAGKGAESEPADAARLPEDETNRTTPPLDGTELETSQASERNPGHS